MEKEEQTGDGLESIRRKAEAFEHEAHDPSQGPELWARLRDRDHTEIGDEDGAAGRKRASPSLALTLLGLLVLALIAVGVVWVPTFFEPRDQVHQQILPTPVASSLARPLAHYRSSSGDLVVVFRLLTTQAEADAVRKSAEVQPHRAGAQTTLFYFPAGAKAPPPSGVSGADSTVAAVNRVYEDRAVSPVYHVFQRYRDGQVRFVNCPVSGEALCK